MIDDDGRYVDTLDRLPVTQVTEGGPGHLPTWSIETDFVPISGRGPKYAHPSDDVVEAEIANELGAFGLDVEVLDFHGPGGGWPVIKVTGNANRILRFMAWLQPDSSVDGQHI